MDIRKLPEQNPRVETGPTQFGEDWPGLFIRGDNAFYYAMQLRHLLDELKLDGIDLSPDALAVAVLRGLLSDLENTRV